MDIATPEIPLQRPATLKLNHVERDGPRVHGLMMIMQSLLFPGGSLSKLAAPTSLVPFLELMAQYSYYYHRRARLRTLQVSGTSTPLPAAARARRNPIEGLAPPEPPRTFQS